MIGGAGPAVMVGETISRYRIIEQFGEGGIGGGVSRQYPLVCGIPVTGTPAQGFLYPSLEPGGMV
jgi:hypothetical protein